LRPRLPPFAITRLRATIFATGLRTPTLTLRCDFVQRDPAISVAIEFAEHVGGVRDFLGVEHPVVIRIERAEEPRRPSLAACWRAFAARAALALRRLRRTRWRSWLIVLREKRARGKRERQRGEKWSISFHGFLAAAVWRVRPRHAARVHRNKRRVFRRLPFLRKIYTTRTAPRPALSRR
jgi:hypothetical protein